MDNEFGKWAISEEDLATEIAAAKARARAADEVEPRAISVTYDPDSRRVQIELSNDCLFAFPADLIAELRSATPAQRAGVRVAAFGTALFWDELDAQYGVMGLLTGVFGTKAWMKALGRIGGRRSSEAKSLASRENGRKGGRPKSVSEHHLAEMLASLNQWSIELKASDLFMAFETTTRHALDHSLETELSVTEARLLQLYEAHDALLNDLSGSLGTSIEVSVQQRKYEVALSGVLEEDRTAVVVNDAGLDPRIWEIPNAA